MPIECHVTENQCCKFDLKMFNLTSLSDFKGFSIIGITVKTAVATLGSGRGRGKGNRVV